jgi:hypothetical protein
MATALFKNTPPTTLAGPITATATTLSVASGAGATFPSPGAGQFFYAFLTDAATRTVKEVVQVTAVTGDAMNVVRGQDGTSASAWGAGDFFVHGPSAAWFNLMAQAASIGGGGGGFYEGTDTSSSGNTVTVPTTTPAITSPTAGNIFFVIKGVNGNTGSVNCSIGSGSSIPILYADGSTLGPADWPGGTGAWLYFPTGGANYQFLGRGANLGPATIHYGIAGGTGDALTATVVPPIGALLAGMVFEIKLTATNSTTTPNISINGNAPVTILNSKLGAVAAGDLSSGVTVLMSYNGTNLQLLGGVSSAGGWSRPTRYDSSTTFTMPAGKSEVLVIVTGGGGGGGVNASCGAGGGAGATVEDYENLAPGTVVPITVGAGGAGGASTSSWSTGSAGGTSSFGAYAVAGGGGGGSNYDEAGAGGVPTAGLIQIPGGDGGVALGTSGTLSGGGGASYWGGGGQGAYYGFHGSSPFHSNGTNGSAPGSGGGGGDPSMLSPASGGNGANGMVLVYTR